MAVALKVRDKIFNDILSIEISFLTYCVIEVGEGEGFYINRWEEVNFGVRPGAACHS